MVQQFEKNENCNVCNTRVNEIDVNEESLFKDFLQNLIKRFVLNAPAIYDGNNLVFMSGEGSLANSLKFKLDRNLKYKLL